MSKGMKIYAVVVALIIAALLANWLWVPGDVRAINRQLAADEYLAAYPYPFRVLRIEGQTAVVSTPRSAVVSVPQMIKAIDPALDGASINDPAYLQAQQALADHQAYAAAKVVETETIKQVIWELDRSWLRAHGIEWVE